MEKLIIIGDSWSCGEWAHDNTNVIKLNHPGMTEYLPYNTVNLSKGGTSNWNSLYTMFNYMNQMQDIDEPYSVVIFQTDPVRTSKADKLGVDITDQIQQASSLEQLYTALAEIFYIKISNFSKQFNIPVYVVGGLSDVDDSVFSLYNNKENIICKSWIKLLYNNHIPNVIPVQVNAEHFTTFKELGRIDLCEQLIEFSDKNFGEFTEILGLDTFGPALGDFHPSRLGHQILANHITNFFDNKLKLID